MIPTIDLSKFSERMEKKYPHVANVNSVRQRAATVVASILTGLKQARVSAGQKQSDVAAALGVSQSTVSRIEGGAEEISLATLSMYAAACNYRVAFLLIPESDSLESEAVSTDLIEGLVEQAYPEIDLDKISQPRLRKSALETSQSNQESKQIASAIRLASLGLTSLGVALHAIKRERVAPDSSYG